MRGGEGFIPTCSPLGFNPFSSRLAFVPGAREEAPDGGLQHLHSPGLVPLPAAPHPGNAAASLTIFF